ncbi:MAG TPA: nuclear transport factor 2 family protein [Terriglobales bacterium]|nr:nuclear transport factor 2 family protein [Terriglobales bacterium]
MKAMSLAAAVFVALFSVAPGHPALPLEPSAQSDGESTAKAELLALHQADRRAHFNRDVDAILSTIGPDFTYVRDGKIKEMSRDDVRKQFTEYFRGAEFSAWDDLEPPIVRVSPDGQMGWMIVLVRVAYTKTGADGKKSQDESVIAWMSAYEKRDGKWLHIANASTFEP